MPHPGQEAWQVGRIWRLRAKQAPAGAGVHFVGAESQEDEVQESLVSRHEIGQPVSYYPACPSPE